jgi:hypothetical protein
MKKKIFSLCAIFALLFVLFFPRGDKVAASGDNLAEDSVISPAYSSQGDRSKWHYLPQFATTVQSTLVYQDQKIYVLLYDISYETPLYRNPGNYILKHYIRTADGNVFWYPDVDREVLLNDNSDINTTDQPATMHRSFPMPLYEISGASPLKPSIAFSKGDNCKVTATFSGKADTNKTVFYYDYYAVKKGTGDKSYIADEGAESNATDYLTGFYYKIDTNPCDIPWDDSWTRMDSGDYTGSTKALDLNIPQKNVCTDTKYYIHTVSRSYTSKLSPVTTAEIPHMGSHTLKYDVNGGTGDFPDQRKHYGSSLHVHSHIPVLTHHTFKGWKSVDNDIYQADDSYGRDQDGGEYTLTAQWEMNKYTFHFDKNEKNGNNGRITGEMPDVTYQYDVSGLPENKYVNTSTQPDGRPGFSFLGWSTDANATEPMIHASISDPDEWRNYPVGSIIDSLGLAESPNSVITLYAVWDKAPEVTSVKDVYISKQDVKKGVSPVSLMKYLVVNDREDGIISPSNSVINGSEKIAVNEAPDTIRLVNYKADDLNIPGDKGAVSVTALATDKVCNTAVVSYMIYIYDASPKKANDGGSEEYVRFIDSSNINKSDSDGGLSDRSIWKLDDSYKKSVDNAFSGKYRSSWSFTAEDIQNGASDVRRNGLGNYNNFAGKYMN